MVTLIPWWSRILVGVLVIVAALAASVFSGLEGMQMLYVFYPLVIIAHYGIETLRPGGSLRSSGLGLTPRSLAQWTLGLGIALASIAVVVGVALALGASFIPGTDTRSWEWLPALILASIGEEVLFRGTVFEALRERFNANWAVMITSVIFGIAHLGNDGSSIVAVVNVTCAGVLLGAMVIRTSSLWMSIGYHIAWNGTLHVFVGSVSGSKNSGVVTQMVTSNIDPSIRWIVDGPFGIEQGLVTTIVLTAGIVATAGWARPDRYVRAAKLRRMRREHELSRSN